MNILQSMDFFHSPQKGEVYQVLPDGKGILRVCYSGNPVFDEHLVTGHYGLITYNDLYCSDCHENNDIRPIEESEFNFYHEIMIENRKQWLKDQRELALQKFKL